MSLEIDPAATEWTFKELALGSWVFTARASALPAGEENHCAWGKSRELPLESAGDYGGIQVTLKEFGIRGVVTEASGVPMAGIQVNYSLQSADPMAGELSAWRVRAGGESRSPFDRSVFLNPGVRPVLRPADGRLVYNGEIKDAISGEAFELLATSREDFREFVEQAMSEQSVSGQSLTVNGGSPNLDDAAFRKPTYTAIEGLKFDGEDLSPSIPRSGQVTSDGSGRFWIALPGPGEVTLRVEATAINEASTDPGHLTNVTSVDLTDETPVQDAAISLERAAAIMGRLVRGDGQVETISVFLRSADGGNSSTSETDKSGYFKFSTRKPGRHLFYARSGGKSGQDFCASSEVELTAGTIYLLDDVLTRSSGLTGVIVNGEGEPVAGAQVTAFGANNRELSRGGRTDEWGVFTIAGMYAVDYALEVSGRPVGDGTVFPVPPRGGTANAGTLVLRADTDTKR